LSASLLWCGQMRRSNAQGLWKSLIRHLTLAAALLTQSEQGSNHDHYQ